MVFDNKTEISQSPIAFGLYSTRKYLLCGYIKVCLGQTISLQGETTLKLDTNELK